MTGSILDLPDSILLQIFSFFSQRELLLSLSSVCRRFFAVSRDSTLWRDQLCQPVQSGCLSDEQLEFIIGLGGKDITHLRVAQQTSITGSALSNSIDLFINLRSLDLSGCSGLEPQVLSKLLGSGNYRLHTLILDGVDIPDTVLEACVKSIASRLHYLSLKRSTGFTHVGLRSLLAHCKALIVLYLDHLITKVVDQVLTVICNQCKNLRYLGLRGCINLSKEALTWSCLLPHLNGLDISDIPTVDAHVIAALAVRAAHLKKLSVAGCLEFKDSSLLALVEAGNDCHLEVLECSSTPITNLGIRTLCRSDLGQRLKEVNASDCQRISTTAVMCLAALSKMVKVTAVHVESSDAMESMIRSLSDVKIFTMDNLPPIKVKEDNLVVSRTVNKFSYKNLDL